MKIVFMIAKNTYNFHRMHKKIRAFTVIEICIVFLTIDVLILVSVFAMKPYFAQRRDAQRLGSMQTMVLLMKADAVGKREKEKYLFSDKNREGEDGKVFPGLRELFRENKFISPRGYNDICYFIGMGVGEKYNEFVFTTWGELTSTLKSRSEGLLVKGTSGAVNAFLVSEDFAKEDFSCTGTFDKQQEVFRSFMSNNQGIDPLFLYLDKEGLVRKIQ